MSNSEIKRKGKLLVLSAPSGAGKSTLANMILTKYGTGPIGNNTTSHHKTGFCPSISYTTRAPRGQEANGVHYFFVSEPTFLTMIEAGEFLEYARVFNKYYYGTSRASVEQTINKGINVIFDIDVQGAHSLKKIYGPQCTTIFILPPSFEELAARLRGRKTESEEAIALRLQTARAEMTEASQFDYRVTNHDLNSSFSEIDLILRKEGFFD